MFQCYLHNWFSHNDACPLCVPILTNSTIEIPPMSADNKQSLDEAAEDYSQGWGTGDDAISFKNGVLSTTAKEYWFNEWQSQQKETKPTGLSKDEILSPLISEMGYSLSNIQSVTGFANDFLNVCYKAMERYRNTEETKPVEDKEAQLEPIQNALYATGKFTTDECTELANGILIYINENQTPKPVSEEGGKASKLEHNKSIFHLGQCTFCYSDKIL